MTPSASAVPREIYYHFVDKSQSIDRLIHSLYKNPTVITVDHFKAINQHLKNGQVKVGQLIIVTPANSQQCSRFEADLMSAADLVDQKLAKLSVAEKQIIAENYQLLNNVASMGGVGYGAALMYFGQHVRNVEGILKQIETLYVQTYNASHRLNSSQFYQKRRQLFMRLDSTLKTFVGRARMGFTLDQANIKNSLGLSSKSILHQWRQQPGAVTGVPGFEKNYNNAAKLSKTLRAAGHIGIALDVGQSGLKIHEACTIGTDQQCAKTSFGEGGRLSGSVLGGSFGGVGAVYVTCNLVFGIQTAGSSLLWCGIVAGVAGSYAGGKFLGDVGKNSGEMLYGTIYR